MRGEDAKRLLEDPMFDEAFEEVKAAYMDALMQCPRRDAEGRGYLLDGLKVLDLVKQHLSWAVSTGEFSKKQAEQLKNPDGDSKVMNLFRSRSV